jgi:ribonuclease Z
MRPVFHPRLVNGSFEDPALYIPLTFRKQALLFDLGDLTPLSPRDIIKLSHIFVSHTHVDHFIGFDRVLRVLLGRPKTIYLYGPRGFLDHIAGKLSGYTWNLVENYDDALVIKATEITEHQQISQTFDCRTGFVPSAIDIRKKTGALAYQDPEFMVTTAILDHRIPCLGFCVQERFHVNIMKARLEDLDLSVGPWLTQLKRLIHEGADPATEIHVPMESDKTESRTYDLAYLTREIALITPGQKTAYIADVIYSPENEAKIINLARNADRLYIEAVFLESEQQVAEAKYHLTARQAGLIAHKAGVKQMTVFHHSPRYTDQGDLLVQEAQEAFRSGE